MSPLQLTALLGVMQWHALLNRPSLSIFHEVYAFTRSVPSSEAVLVPDAVIQELLVFVLHTQLLQADVTRPWCDTVIATDASPSFGFGVSVKHCSAFLVRKCGRRCAVPGSYIMTDDTTSGAKLRCGTPHSLGLRQLDFHTVVSRQARFKAHSGSLQAGAVTFGLRWAFRSSRYLRKRIAMLVDAQAVTGALRRGRSSAPTLRHEMQQIVALSLVSGCIMKCIYIPSEHNPADAPSRGVHSTAERASL